MNEINYTSLKGCKECEFFDTRKTISTGKTHTFQDGDIPCFHCSRYVCVDDKFSPIVKGEINV